MLKVSKWRHVPNRFAAALWVVVATALAVLSAGPASAAPYNLTSLNVVGPNGEAITGYRWLIQEDTMKASVPGGPAVPGSALSVSFHTSYAPPVAAGCISCGLVRAWCKAKCVEPRDHQRRGNARDRRSDLGRRRAERR